MIMHAVFWGFWVGLCCGLRPFPCQFVEETHVGVTGTRLAHYCGNLGLDQDIWAGL